MTRLGELKERMQELGKRRCRVGKRIGDYTLSEIADDEKRIYKYTSTLLSRMYFLGELPLVRLNAALKALSDL